MNVTKLVFAGGKYTQTYGAFDWIFNGWNKHVVTKK